MTRKRPPRPPMQVFDSLPRVINSVAGSLHMPSARWLIRKYGVERAAYIILTDEGLVESLKDYQVKTEVGKKA